MNTEIEELVLPDRSGHPTASPQPDKLAKIAKRIVQRGGQFVIDTGNDLMEAKTLLPHGQFQPWLEANFDWSLSTAQRYMQSAKLAAETPIVTDLPPAALYALAAPGTPKSVQNEVIAELEAGKRLTAKDVRDKIRKASIASDSRRDARLRAAIAKPEPDPVASKPEQQPVTSKGEPEPEPQPAVNKPEPQLVVSKDEPDIAKPEPADTKPKLKPVEVLEKVMRIVGMQMSVQVMRRVFPNVTIFTDSEAKAGAAAERTAA